MHFLIILAWFSLILFGTVIGMAMARMSALLVLNQSSNLNFFSTLGAIICGVIAAACGAITIFWQFPSPFSLLSGELETCAVTMIASLVLPAFMGIYLISSLAMAGARKLVDKIYKPK